MLVAASILFAGACDTGVPTLSDASQARSSAAQSQRNPMVHRANTPLGADSVYYAIAGRVPGFAGLYFDRGGTRNILLADPGRSEQARLEVAEYLQRGHGKPLGQVRLVPVRYDFRQLYAWRTAILQVLAETNVAPANTSIGICEHENRVCIGARRGGGLGVLRDVITRLGIPADAVRITEEDPLQSVKTLDDTFAEVPAGVLIDDICTLGFNGYRFDGKRAFVTAAHCTIQYASISPADVFGQPDDGVRRIGVESYDPPTFACTGYPKCRFSDAAEILYYDAVAWRLGRIARPHFEQTTIDPNNPEFHIRDVSAAHPVYGQQLHRVGRTTGWRTGLVEEDCTDITHYYEGVGDVRLLCQSTVGASAQPGDSGGPVFGDTYGGVTLWGITIISGPLGYRFSSFYNIWALDGFGNYDVESR